MSIFQGPVSEAPGCQNIGHMNMNYRSAWRKPCQTVIPSAQMSLTHNTDRIPLLGYYPSTCLPAYYPG